MDVVSYTTDRESEWNEFVSESKNGTFMFDRDYMEYHSDRFKDASLMVYHKNSPIALLPANREGDELVSHGGLTFGGFVIDERMTMPKMMEVFDAVEEYLVGENIDIVRYKSIPTIYHTIPAEGDRYALFRRESDLYRRDVTSAVPLSNSPGIKKNRRRSISTAENAGVTVRESDDFDTYWDILSENLEERHDTEPVHTVDEIMLLHDRFPENIRLYGAFLDGEMEAGVVTYESDNTARTQYIASSDTGREHRATDYLFAELIKDGLHDHHYLDLGISTEKAGAILNEGLIYFKETFGARPIVHDFYLWEVNP